MKIISWKMFRVNLIKSYRDPTTMTVSITSKTEINLQLTKA